VAWKGFKESIRRRKGKIRGQGEGENLRFALPTTERSRQKTAEKGVGCTSSNRKANNRGSASRINERGKKERGTTHGKTNWPDAAKMFHDRKTLGSTQDSGRE